MQIAIFKQPWRIKVKETLGFGHHYCPLRGSIPQPRDVNAIEQLRTAREATTIDSCGYRCAGGQCAQPGTAYRRSRPASKFGPPLGRILGVHVVSCGAIGALLTSVGLFHIEAAARQNDPAATPRHRGLKLMRFLSAFASVSAHLLEGATDSVLTGSTNAGHSGDDEAAERSAQARKRIPRLVELLRAHHCHGSAPENL
jgi:hypothetical protein